MSAAADREIEDLDATLAADGQDVTIYRVVTSSSPPVSIEVNVRAFVRPYRPTPDEITGGIVQDWWHVICSPTEIIAGSWPGAWAASPAEPVQTELDRRIPVKNDKVTVAGRARNIERAAPFYVDGDLCRIELWAKG